MSHELYRRMITPHDWAAVGGILGTLVLLGAAFYYFVYSAQRTEIDTLISRNEQTLADLAEARRKAETIDQLREEMAKIQELVSEFEQRLPSTRELATLVTQFERMASSVGLRVNVTPLPPESDPRKQTIPYRIRAYGTFHQLAGFINRLERFERYLKVSDLDIREETDGESEAEFKLSTYLFLQESGGDRSDAVARAAAS